MMMQIVTPILRQSPRLCHGGVGAVVDVVSSNFTSPSISSSSIHHEHSKQLLRAYSSSSPSSSSAAAVAHTLLILGKPGGGKGTISSKILSDFPQFKHVSTGDELRQHVRNGTELGLQAKKFMDEGLLVPDEVMIKMVFATTQSASATGQSLLLDGFPRTLSQAQSLDNTLTINHVINLCIPNEIIVERISDRWIHPASGRVYSYSYRPPKVHGIDDETGEQLVQRDDDKPASVMRRLEKYEEATRPLVDYYRDKGVLQTFKGTMSDVIYVDVKRWLEEKLAGDDDEEDEKEMKG
ncbi:hypothetical protein ACHAWU_002655 [Discostella pseudostelligera]|uniref:GTP:AMP phosphotransferase, mitochondrial n=1 Tax=Discostella pseudostelligera TaxID=259834 RepID=A0ABD3LWI0_9STRA